MLFMAWNFFSWKLHARKFQKKKSRNYYQPSFLKRPRDGYLMLICTDDVNFLLEVSNESDCSIVWPGCPETVLGKIPQKF